MSRFFDLISDTGPPEVVSKDQTVKIPKGRLGDNFDPLAVHPLSSDTQFTAVLTSLSPDRPDRDILEQPRKTQGVRSHV